MKDIIEVKITDEMIEEAQAKADELGVLKRSVMGGERNLVGFLGERIARDVLDARFANTKGINYNYDLIMPNTGITIDVKSKQCKFKPKLDYTCSVMAYNAESQNCDYYAFVRIASGHTVGWFLGVKEKYQYLRESVYNPKGTAEPNGFVSKEDNYDMSIADLDEAIATPSKINAPFMDHIIKKKIESIEKEKMHEHLWKHDIQLDTLKTIQNWLERNYDTKPN